MKKWVAKLGQGMARLAVWRKRGAAAAEAEAETGPVAVANSSAAPTADSMPAPAVVAAPVALIPSAPSPATADDALTELGDPTAPQGNSIDSLFADGLAELGDASAPVQGETMSADILYTDNSTGGLAELDFIPEPEDEPASMLAAEQAAPEAAAPEQNLAQPAEPQATLSSLATPNASADVLADARVPSSGTPKVDSATESDADPEAISRVQRLKQRARGVLAVFGKKRVWIPSVSLALLAVIGSLSFMLVKASSEKAHLQADLTAAKKALKQVAAQPDVAVIPPLLAVSVPPVEAHPASAPADAKAPPNAAPIHLAAAELSIEPLRMARTSNPGVPVQMDCDVSSKASVAQSLKKCIEAFNQATGH